MERRSTMLLKAWPVISLVFLVCFQYGVKGIKIVKLSNDMKPMFSLEQEIDAKYSVGFLKEEDRVQKDLDQGRGGKDKSGKVVMKLSNGTAFECTFVGTAPAAGAHAKGDKQEDLIPPIANVLESIGDWCAYRVEGWWTYEVCSGRKARQYHKSKAGQIDDEYLLGVYVEENSEHELETTIQDDWLTGRDVYVEQKYENGDNCTVFDVERRRRARVRLHCGHTTDVPLLVNVEEPESCMYMFDVELPGLCDHPDFQPAYKQDKPQRKAKCTTIS